MTGKQALMVFEMPSATREPCTLCMFREGRRIPAIVMMKRFPIALLLCEKHYHDKNIVNWDEPHEYIPQGTKGAMREKGKAHAD